MKSVKCLITAGCSFSQVPNADVTWPVHLNNRLNPETVLYLGQGAAGNGIISRKVIYNTVQMLKKYDPSDILVGIMWSGCNRSEVFSLSPLEQTPYKRDIDYYAMLNHNTPEYSNPLSVIRTNNEENINYYITMQDGRTDDNGNLFLAHDKMIEEDRAMITLEHILRTQWFLKLHNISYFMTEYDYDCFSFGWGDKIGVIEKSEDLMFLWEQIDFKQWLPINNCQEWVTLESGYKHARPPDSHPSTEQHNALVERIIMPFLQQKTSKHIIP